MLVKNRSALSGSGCQGEWAAGNGKRISNAVRLPGLMPKLCFQTIRLVGFSSNMHFWS